MTDAEVDAHLYALGIGSDARGITVLMIGFDEGAEGAYSESVLQRLAAFGASVFQAHETIVRPDLQADYIIALPEDNNLYDIARVVEHHLRPGGRYMILADRWADDRADVELTDVRQVGDGEIRAIGWKRRITGDMGMGGSDEPM